MSERQGSCTRCHNPILSQLAFTLCSRCQLDDQDIPVSSTLAEHLAGYTVDDSGLATGEGIKLFTDKDKFGLMLTEEEQVAAATEAAQPIHFTATGFFRRKFSQAKQAFAEAAGISQVKLPDRSSSNRVFKE